MNISNDLPNNEKSENFKYNIQVLERALQIFEIIARFKTPLSIPELQNLTGLNRTTIWRILSTMLNCGFLTQLPNKKQYCLSCKAYNLLSSSSSSPVALVEAARSEMTLLRNKCNETVMLLVPQLTGSLTVLQLDSFEAIRLMDYTNQLSPLFGTSTGIVQLASMEDEEIIKIFPSALTSYTEFTQTNRNEIMQRIHDCRRDGYSYIIDEFNKGDTGLSAPICLDGQLVGILNISGPTVRYTKEKMLVTVPMLLEATRQIVSNLSV